MQRANGHFSVWHGDKEFCLPTADLIWPGGKLAYLWVPGLNLGGYAVFDEAHRGIG
jgi:hypothetical protein